MRSCKLMEKLKTKPKLYKIVKYCKLCKKKFFLQSLKNDHCYCEDCYKRMRKG